MYGGFYIPFATSGNKIRLQDPHFRKIRQPQPPPPARHGKALEGMLNRYFK